MVVNLRHGEGKSAAATKATVTLTFRSSVASVHRLSRRTGGVESLPLSGNRLQLDLPGGTGELRARASRIGPALRDHASQR